MNEEHPPSLWLASANPGPALPRLNGNVQTDIAIIGAGYTGLAAAHHLSRAGVACVVLEAKDAGWGASGRNGGMAVLRYKTRWSELALRLGRERTRHLHRLLHQAMDLLEQTVAEHGIDCGFERCGHITAANGLAALARLEKDVQSLAVEVGDKVPRLLVAAETKELTGKDSYVGGYLDPRAGAIHPLNYARGLAQALNRKGVPIYVGSEVRDLREEGQGVALETPFGVVSAKQALVATNAYTDAVRFGTDLGRRIIPVWTSIITTQPLADEMLRRILPQRHVVSDTRHLLNYFRIAPGNRLLYGGRGVVLTNLLGKMLMQLALGERIDAGPMSAAPFRRIPLHALRIPAMKAVAGYYSLLDCLRL